MIDPQWAKLRRQTTARVALGRAGGSLPTAAVLAFAADHAAARDAVYAEMDLSLLNTTLSSLHLPTLFLQTRAPDRRTYLQRPDLGRRLNAASAALIKSNATSTWDVALVIGDGLSAQAAQIHAGAVLGRLIPRLRSQSLTVAPLSVVTQARVAIQDEIGSLFNARLAVILLGERPGLGTADSLGAYLIYQPSIGKTDADRNCISNIRPQQLHPVDAADTLLWLIEQSLHRGISGVQLKDDRQNGQLVLPRKAESPALE